LSALIVPHWFVDFLSIIKALGAMLRIINNSFSYQVSKGVKNIEPFLLAKDSVNQPTAFELDLIDGLSLVLSCQIFFLPLSALIVPHWFVDFLSIRFCGLPFGY
jgi:Uri superfamily endonuclease